MNKLTSLALFSLLPVGANAATLTFSEVTGSGGNAIFTRGDLNTLTLPKFDTLGGTRVLTSVEFNFSLTVPSAEFTVTNGTDGDGVDGTASFGAFGSTAFLSSELIFGTPQFASDAVGAAYLGFTTESFIISPSLDSGQSQTFNSTATVLGTGGFVPIAGGISLSDYVASGGDTSFDATVQKDFAGSASTSGGGQNGNVTVETIIPQSVYTAEVRYTYDTIPEPSSSALLALGALGLAMRRRRA